MLNKSKRLFFIVGVLLAFPFICLFPSLFLNLPSHYVYNAILFYFIFILLCLIVIILFYSTTYLVEEISKLSWKRVAVISNLEFISGNFFKNGAFLRGDYEGYQLILEAIRDSRTYTQITLSNNDNKLVEQLPFLDNKQAPNQKSMAHFGSRLLEATNLSLSADGLFNIEPGGKCIYYRQTSIENDDALLLHLFDKMRYLLDIYPQILNTGAKSILSLQNISLNPRHQLQLIARQLMYDIALNTEKQLAHRLSTLFCRDCLCRYTVHEEKVSPFSSINYYACRICLDSQNFFEGKVIVILHNQLPEERLEDHNTLRVKWVPGQALFEFDAIEIIQATDEEGERFAVSVANDTHALRKPHYHKMDCFIAPDCALSENTIKILQDVFGEVKKTR